MHLKCSLLSDFSCFLKMEFLKKNFKNTHSATTYISDLGSKPELLCCLGKLPKAASVSISEK